MTDQDENAVKIPDRFMAREKTSIDVADFCTNKTGGAGS